MGYGYLYGELKKSDSATYCEVTVLQEVKSSLIFSEKNKLIILIFVLFFRQKIFSQTMSKPAFFKYLCLAFAFSGCLHAQNCDNLDFARGNFNGWTGKSWIYTVYPDWYTNTLPVTGTANGRFAIMKDTTAYDVNTGDALKIIPKGYKYVARLGNDASGCNRQSLSYKINVDQQNALLVWRFAVIMEDPH